MDFFQKYSASYFYGVPRTNWYILYVIRWRLALFRRLLFKIQQEWQNGNGYIDSKISIRHQINVENLFFGRQPNCLCSQTESTHLQGMSQEG